jgi:hypothetical protein
MRLTPKESIPLPSDRRKRPRLPLCLQATVRKLGGSRSEEARTVDLSCSGVRLRSSASFALNDRVEITMTFGDLIGQTHAPTTLSCLGRVVWAQIVGGDNECAFACRIEDYKLEPAAPEPVPRIESLVASTG